MKVLVCGGRDYKDSNKVFSVLDAIHKLHGIDLLIAGGAPGADTLAEEWASERGIPKLIIKADWLRYGHAAGPRRNRTMLLEGKPDGVVAFPGQRGTQDMIERAEYARIPVHRPCKEEP